ncbi:MAG: DUF86 domain-containing protein [Alphaproteobacteria bacterium]|nr:DUF86 domain-containing protein [Alphaproteobacteria bacterium]
MPYPLNQRLRDIKKAIEYALTFVADTHESDFLEDMKTQSAVERQLEIIGEASNQIIKKYKKFCQENQTVPWEELRGLRNLVSHEYFRHENIFEIWEATTETLPMLHHQIDVLIDKALEFEKNQNP